MHLPPPFLLSSANMPAPCSTLGLRLEEGERPPGDGGSPIPCPLLLAEPHLSVYAFLESAGEDGQSKNAEDSVIGEGRPRRRPGAWEAIGLDATEWRRFFTPFASRSVVL
jgi:hypothetical protein